MSQNRPFHETLNEVSTSYFRARRDLDRAMLRGDREKIDQAIDKVREIEACVDLRLKRPLPI